ncbi:hypothetical protein ACFQO4_03340 [Saliphagus sp. GCM10025334]
MNRRELLAASAVSVLLGAGGCIADLDPQDENSTDLDDENTSNENAVPGCTSKAEWADDHTDGPFPSPDSIAGHRNCANADRPEPTGDVCETFEVEGEDGETTEFYSAGVESYPDPPSDFDAITLQSYVFEYELAYTQNWAVLEHEGEKVVEFSFTSHDTAIIDGDDEITAIYIAFGFAFRRASGSGTGGYYDAFGEGAIYGIDETGVVRADADYYHNLENLPDDSENLPDPVEDGDLLQCF